MRLAHLRREHPRRSFHCGEEAVENWLTTKALQHREKHLSVTKVLLAEDGRIAGYYTLATGQVNFGDLPAELGKELPRRLLPVAVLARLGVSTGRQRQGLGRLLLAQALRACWEAGRTFAFVAVILDCVSAAAKTFANGGGFESYPAIHTGFSSAQSSLLRCWNLDCNRSRLMLE
jgi:GNAT superfamily N-acetyltransferase